MKLKKFNEPVQAALFAKGDSLDPILRLHFSSAPETPSWYHWSEGGWRIVTDDEIRAFDAAAKGVNGAAFWRGFWNGMQGAGIASAGVLLGAAFVWFVFVILKGL